MQIQELSARECHEVLNNARVARLATAHENQPYVVPIHIYFDGADLYSFATLGRKIDWMRANPKVCVEAEDVIDRFHWRTVVVLGRYRRTSGRAGLREVPTAGTRTLSAAPRVVAAGGRADRPARLPHACHLPNHH